MTEDFHQISAVVTLAIVPADSEQAAAPTASIGSPLADRARGAVARVGRANYEVRDALWATIEALGSLERTVARLERILALRDLGIELRPELVQLSAAGLGLQRRGPWREDQQVRIHLSLDLRDTGQLLTLRGSVQVHAQGAFVRFQDLRPDESDLLVAFVFQQEAKERRRALDADH